MAKQKLETPEQPAVPVEEPPGNMPTPLEDPPPAEEDAKPAAIVWRGPQ